MIGVSYVDADGITHEIGARYVVDASGHGSRLHNAVGGRREYSPFFRNLAVFSYFEDGARLPEPNSGNILCAAFGRGWFWYIPLSDRLTSVGAVLGVDDAADVQKDPEAAFEQLITRVPADREATGRTRAGPRTSRTTGSGSARTSPTTGARCGARGWCWSATPAASSTRSSPPACTSSTYSALLAARSINSVLAGVVDEDRSFDEFETRYRREFAVFRDFLVAFYKMHVAEDTYYWEAKQIAQHDGARAGGVRRVWSAACPAGRCDAAAARAAAGGADDADPAAGDRRVRGQHGDGHAGHARARPHRPWPCRPTRP